MDPSGGARVCDPQPYRADWASSAFLILRTNAASAIPELETMMRDITRKQTSDNAIDALGGIGEPALPSLKAALAEARQINLGMIVVQFKSMAVLGHSKTYLPLLVNALNHENAAVRDAATDAAWKSPPQFVPNAPRSRRFVY